MPEEIVWMLLGGLAALGLEHYVYPVIAHRWAVRIRRHVGAR